MNSLEYFNCSLTVSTSNVNVFRAVALSGVNTPTLNELTKLHFQVDMFIWMWKFLQCILNFLFFNNKYLCCT